MQMSSRRNNLRQFQVYTNANSTTSPVTTATDVSGLDNITYLVTVGSLVNGELKVEFSNAKDLQSAITFYALDFGEQLILDGPTELLYTIKIDNHGFKFMRLTFTNGSGSGNINAWVSGNTVGA